MIFQSGKPEELPARQRDGAHENEYTNFDKLTWEANRRSLTLFGAAVASEFLVDTGQGIPGLGGFSAKCLKSVKLHGQTLQLGAAMMELKRCNVGGPEL